MMPYYSTKSRNRQALHGCLSVGNDRPALMMAGRKEGGSMTEKEFAAVTRALLVAWFLEMYRYIAEDDLGAKKIEPPQKRQLIATAQSLLHDFQDSLDRELGDSD